MDPISIIAAALVAGAAEAAQPTAAQAVKDAYAALKNALIKKFGGQADVIDAAKKVEEKPASQGRADTLKEELEAVKDKLDAELVDLAKKVDAALKRDGSGAVTNTGDGAIAYGAGATAVSKGGVIVNGDNSGPINTGTQTTINTGGAPYIGGKVNAGRDFVSGDKTEIHYHGAAPGDPTRVFSEAGKKLAKILNDYFSESELEGLAFEMNVDWENLPGNTKEIKAREFVKFSESRNRLTELQKLVRVARPNLRGQV